MAKPTGSIGKMIQDGSFVVVWWASHPRGKKSFGHSEPFSAFWSILYLFPSIPDPFWAIINPFQSILNPFPIHSEPFARHSHLFETILIYSQPFSHRQSISSHSESFGCFWMSFLRLDLTYQNSAAVEPLCRLVSITSSAPSAPDTK